MRIVLNTVRLVCFTILELLAFSTADCQGSDSDSTGSNDTSNYYYSDHSDLINIKLFTSTKWNTLEIHKDGEPLKLRPNSPTSLGVGFNYKSFGLSLALGLPKSTGSIDKYGKTKRLDIQASVYGKKFGFDGFAQLYKSYYNANPDDFIDWNSDSFPVLSDMDVISIGANAFYLFNPDKFSYKAAFVRNQVQLQSAGSFILGMFGHYDLAKTDQGFVPDELPDSLKTNFDLKSFSTIAVGVTVGYIYTWVISKHFFLNISLTPGFGYQNVELESLDGTRSNKHSPAAQLSGRSALGYESNNLYLGLTGSVVWRNVKYKGYELDLSTEQVKFFIGKRF